MRNISFLGAAGDVTGSSFLITAQNNDQLLIDFGMFQGRKEIVTLNYQPLLFKPSQLKAVVLTHAHLDHCGRLPLLVYGGFTGKIYMSAPTAALVEVVLIDAAKVSEGNMEYEPLYDLDQVQKTLEMIEVVRYDTRFVAGSFGITLRDAGHILGSSSVEIVDQNSKKKIVFSGDLGNSPEDIVRPTTYIDAADFVVMETTYGDKAHPKEDPSQILQEEIQAIERTGGVLLIPAFSLERTQEILHRIHHLKKDGKIRPDTPVFMDGPMGIRATAVFRQFREFYNEELRSHTDDPFHFEGLVVTEDPRDSKDIIKAHEPKVIIAGSGMMSGGRILHHAANYLSRETTRLLFVGYQAEETLGRRILEGAKNIVINKRSVKVRAKIREIASLSSHADQPKLFKWLEHIKGVRKVFLVHGETTQREVFAQKVIDELRINDVVLPKVGEKQSLEFSVSS